MRKEKTKADVNVNETQKYVKKNKQKGKDIKSSHRQRKGDINKAVGVDRITSSARSTVAKNRRFSLTLNNQEDKNPSAGCAVLSLDSAPSPTGVNRASIRAYSDLASRRRSEGLDFNVLQ